MLLNFDKIWRYNEIKGITAAFIKIMLENKLLFTYNYKEFKY